MITFYCACPNPQGIYNGKWGNNIIYKLKEKKQSKMLFELTHGQIKNEHHSIDNCFLFLKITTCFTEHGIVKVYHLNSHLIKT
jgi:hypothetical protein